MKTMVAAAIVLLMAVPAMAQGPAPSGDLRIFYQRTQGFDFRTGSASFDIRDARFSGGGFGFGYNLTPWFALWSETGFYSGVEQQAVRLRLINNVQGARFRTGDLGPLVLYAKAGAGFTRFVFDVSGRDIVRYGSSFVYGAGAEVALTGATALVFDVSQNAVRLPDVTGRSDRDKWDGSLLWTVGIAFRF